jgi:Glu-tRNA(Gln) amidotransferase subunit E-like FAD-binding protein
MGQIDYKKIGLKSGLEIHQQLDTNKLFCNCPSFLRKDLGHFSIKRKLHKIAGETGEIDTAVKYESSLNKEFIYEGYNDTTCLVELDESPPNQINQQALEEAMKIALLLNCEILPITQIMRKTVIDGSNTSGFQRTLLLARKGHIETSFGNVPIDTLFLEEDSCRPGKGDENDEENSNTKIWKLDRLGIPLVEIATGPHMHSPEQIKEAALKIGEILRACKVKRGIGTIRQDVNISITNHCKVEIKGFQDPAIMIKTIELEVLRQEQELKEGKNESAVRGTLPDGTTKFNRPMPGGARMYPETDLPLLKISQSLINKISKNLPKLKKDIKSDLEKRGLSVELINLILEGNLEEFEVLSKLTTNSNLVAKMITLWRFEQAKKTNKTLEEIKSLLPESVLEKILEAFNEKKIEESDIKNIMEKLAQEQSFHDAIKIEKISHDEIEEEIRKIIKEKPGLRPNAYMGLVMAKLKGKIDAKKSMEIINSVINPN